MTTSPLDAAQPLLTPDEYRRDLRAVAHRMAEFDAERPTLQLLLIQERLARQDDPTPDDLATWPDTRRQWVRRRRARLFQSVLILVLAGVALWWLFSSDLAGLSCLL
ncbi:hypothetical protein K7W42_12685 [Deinococcus sp. HMF7604]|uniref:hypothetical protein n=1 Tax=Deinococcus betulae TaxID=2873312 RepID=UPI001CCE0265|nr:hypothetical protein [Deinococcus betulae]MBZ9751719.1 hypothetical protein [Deinococcus betulae]